jgi:hypothetical protein
MKTIMHAELPHRYFGSADKGKHIIREYDMIDYRYIIPVPVIIFICSCLLGI